MRAAADGENGEDGDGTKNYVNNVQHQRQLMKNILRVRKASRAVFEAFQ